MIRTQLYVTAEHAAEGGGAADAEVAKEVLGTVAYAALQQAAQSGDECLWTKPVVAGGERWWDRRWCVGRRFPEEGNCPLKRACW